VTVLYLVKTFVVEALDNYNLLCYMKCSTSLLPFNTVTSLLPMCTPITPKLVSSTVDSTSQYLHNIHPLLLFLLHKLGFLLRRQVSILQLPHSWTSLKDSLHPTAEVWDTSAVGGAKGQSQMGGTKGQSQMGGAKGQSQMGGTKGQSQMGGTKGQSQMGGAKGQSQMGGIEDRDGRIAPQCNKH